MASGGVGDVLTGMIASLIGQGRASFDAARFGVYLHGLAGDIARDEKTEISLRARDILDNIHKAVKIS
jgi:NAD(P)H-hydrate epimerase